MSRRLSIGLKVAAALFALAAILAVTIVATLRSDWFHQKVRQRIVEELERSTGGSVTLGDFVFDYRLLTVKFQNLTLRGKEPAGAPPLLHAASIEVGLKIISFWKRDVDVQSVIVSEPQVNFIIAADGSTNFPEPKVHQESGKPGLEPILDWKISKFSLENGTLLFAEKKSELNAKGENLHAILSYDLTGPRYKGQVSIQPLEIDARPAPPVKTGVFMTVGLEKNRIVITDAKFDMQGSFLKASGVIEDLAAPKAAFQFSAHVMADQASRLLRTRIARRGIVDLDGEANYSGSSDYTVSARVRARDVDVEQDGVRLSKLSATMAMKLNPRGMLLESVVLNLLGGRFTGRAELPKLERFQVDGTVKGITIQRALETIAPQLPAAQKTTWSGVASGPVHASGSLTGGPVMASAKLTLAPAPGRIPVSGAVDATYDGKSKILSLGQSRIATPGMQLDLSGALGSQLAVRLTSTNLDELLPVVNAFSSKPVAAFPIQLKNGSASFDGSVTGSLDSPQIAGSVALTNFAYSDIAFDRFSGQVNLSSSSVELKNGILARGDSQAQIAGAVGLVNWDPKPESSLTAAVTARGAEVSELLGLAGQKQIPVRGALALTARVSGTIGSYRGSADIAVTKGAAYDEPFDRLQATVDYSERAIEIHQAKLTAGKAQITTSVTFEPARPGPGVPDFRDGRIQLNVVTNDLSIQQFKILKRLRPDVTGTVRVNLNGTATLQQDPKTQTPKIQVTAVNGDITAQQLRLEGRSIGSVKATAKTEAAVANVRVESSFLNSNLTATSQWKLVPGYPGEGSATFTQVSLGTVRDWINKSGEKGDLNFDGTAQGKISISGPALEPMEWKASVELSKLEVFPVEPGARANGTERFTLRNEGPVVVNLNRSVVNVASARFSGPSTDVTIKGSVALAPKTALDLRLNGGVNLAVLQTLTSDIETAGTVSIDASVRGTPDQPQLSGKLEMKRGSLHFADITSGLTGANGTILFSGNQATIQNITGNVGGGKVTLGGVIGYAGASLSYRVDVTANNVRVRYPEGASTSADATLALRGTTRRSTLSGVVTVLRTGFNTRTDFASILGKATEPVRTPSARQGPLTGMHFDVRIETAPNLSFESEMAEDIQVEGNLRLQGTPYNPVLLGRLNITQGEINFFGTKYIINQGSITFANPIKLEPVLNVDLETKVQGIDVTLTVTGPLNKMNVTPRSDPPLAYSEVLALLATGSAPSSDPTLSARQNAPQQSFTQLGASALIGQVVANPVSSRLQRFFGVSRLKIDPQLTGVENNPQARLTVEQQINKNLTFTYITNLATANQQIVRIEWALNKNWSVIAVRDENGLFGMDVLYKRRFK